MFLFQEHDIPSSLQSLSSLEILRCLSTLFNFQIFDTYMEIDETPSYNKIVVKNPYLDQYIFLLRE